MNTDTAINSQRLKKLEDEVAQIKQQLVLDRKSANAIRLEYLEHLSGPRQVPYTRPRLTLPTSKIDSNEVTCRDEGIGFVPAAGPGEPSTSPSELRPNVINNLINARPSVHTGNSANRPRASPNPANSKLNSIKKEKLKVYQEQLDIIESSCKEELRRIELSKAQLTPLLQETSNRNELVNPSPMLENSEECSGRPMPPSGRKIGPTTIMNNIGGYSHNSAEYKNNQANLRINTPRPNECDPSFLPRLPSNKSDLACSLQEAVANPLTADLQFHSNTPRKIGLRSSSATDDEINSSTGPVNHKHSLNKSSTLEPNIEELEQAFDRSCLRREGSASTSTANSDQSCIASVGESQESLDDRKISPESFISEEDFEEMKTWPVDKLLKYEEQVRQSSWEMYYKQMGMLDCDILAPYRSTSMTSSSSVEVLEDGDTSNQG